jgi:hypothetical protein
LTEQHMQPLAKGTKSTGFASVEFWSETVSCFSMSIAIYFGVRQVVLLG